MPTRDLLLAPSILLLTCLAAPAAAAHVPPIALDTVEIVRDVQGVPHVFADTDEGVFHGLGYVTAVDRLFQMEFFRRSMRGRLAEIFPADTHPGAVPSDVLARTIGWGRYADELVADPGFSAPTLAILTAYAAGVNKRLAEVRISGTWPPMFGALGLTSMQDWTASDCVLTWMYASERFGAGDWGDLHWTDPGPDVWPDTGAAVLPDAGDDSFARLLRRALRGGVVPASVDWPQKASHNLVIHGERTASRKPFLLAKPQHPVTSPSLYYEFALTARHGNYDCRGAGLAGSPAFFHGWNRFAAWSCTSLTADISDVYEVDFDDAQQTLYTVSGVVPAQQTVVSYPQETILVLPTLGGTHTTIPWTHRRTMWGPLITAYVDSPHAGSASQTPPAGSGWALRTLVLDDAVLRKEASLMGGLGLMRARTKAELVAGARLWRSPGSHLLVATTDGVNGEIGYRALTGLPSRPYAGLDRAHGHLVLDGNTIASTWGEVPFDALPNFLGNPFPVYGKRYFSTANNLACDPLDLPPNQPFVLGSMGDTERSWRLREELDRRLAPGMPRIRRQDMLTIDKDSVHPGVRTFVELARVIHDGPSFDFTGNALTMLNDVSTWQFPWSMDAVNAAALYQKLAKLGPPLGTLTPAMAGPQMIATYGKRHGVIALFRDVEATGALAFYQNSAFPSELEQWAQKVLNTAYGTTTSATPDQWQVHHQDNLKPLTASGSGNWPAQSVTLSGLACPHLKTIWAQAGETYKFLADFDAALYPDGNLALLAPGVSEDWNDAWSASTPQGLYGNHVDGWKSGSMYAAKLSRGTFTETVVKTLQY